jgi:hypothetical protein
MPLASWRTYIVSLFCCQAIMPHLPRSGARDVALLKAEKPRSGQKRSTGAPECDAPTVCAITVRRGAHVDGIGHRPGLSVGELLAISSSGPDEEWAKLPEDGAETFHWYLHDRRP